MVLYQKQAQKYYRKASLSFRKSVIGPTKLKLWPSKALYCNARPSSFNTHTHPHMHARSLPRFKVSGDIKGFAFVEFSKKEGADSAVSVSAIHSLYIHVVLFNVL